MPRWVVADENQDEASTSEEESTDQEDEGDEEEEEDAAGPSGVDPEAEAEAEAQAPGSSKKRDKISIPLGKLVCHVRSLPTESCISPKEIQQQDATSVILQNVWRQSTQHTVCPSARQDRSFKAISNLL